MKQLILLAMALFAISPISFSQETAYTIETEQPCNTSCCPIKTTVTIYQDAISTLNTVSIPVIVPPIQSGGNGVTSMGVRLACAPMMQVYSGSGAGFVFQSGAYIRIQNSAGVLPTLGEWSDPCVTTNGSYVADNWRSYEIVHASQDDATVFLLATAPITGGSLSGKIVFTFWYYLENY